MLYQYMPIFAEDCGSAPSFNNATLDPSDTDDSLAMECDPGHMITSNGHVTCKSGDWHVELPQCEGQQKETNKALNKRIYTSSEEEYMKLELKSVFQVHMSIC